MGYRVAICDDSREDAAFENALLQEWAKARQIDAEAELFSRRRNFCFIMKKMPLMICCCWILKWAGWTG